MGDQQSEQAQAAVFNIVAVVALLAYPAAGADDPPENGFSGQNPSLPRV